MKSNLLNLLTEDTLEKWRQLYPSLYSVHISDKGLLYRQGYSCNHVFLISEGVVKLSYITEQGNEWTIALLGREDIIGRLQADSTTDAMEETAQALGEVTLYCFELHDFKALILHQPELSWQFFQRQCARRRQAERKLLNISAQPIENRIIEMLTELAKMFGIRCTHGHALEIHLTQQDLADLVGASRPVVSTIMNELRNRGKLDYTRDLICVKDVLFSNFGKRG